uniref:ORF314 n=1 Tax=Leptospirillum ferrooxidans TaxID=180 RepID=Q58KF3_9BACT|nr:MBG domain-containing protein [Leptospirillum ferrooxidans]AAX36055.1 ORF314 [Leptospirillum ferrooxidans]
MFPEYRQQILETLAISPGGPPQTSAEFNTWDSSTGAFRFPATSAPWVMGTVYPNGGTTGIAAPILVSDMGTAAVTAKNASMIYSGSAYAIGSNDTVSGATLAGTVADSTSSVNASPSPYTITPVVSALSSPSQTDAGFFSYTKGSLTITKAPLTVTASPSSMIYGSQVPALTGTVTGFVGGQTLASDGGTATWTTTATASNSVGSYGVTGGITLGSPYSGDYMITNAPGNATALTIPVAPTVDNPVLQTVGNNQSIAALPEISSVTTANDSSSPSTPTSITSSTLSETGNSSLKVIQPAEPGGGEILSVEKVTK